MAKGRFFKGVQNYIENKNERNENKIILGDLIVLWIKVTGMVRIRHKDFNYVPIVNNGLRIYGEKKTQVLLSFPAMIGPLSRIQDKQGLY